MVSMRYAASHGNATLSSQTFKWAARGRRGIVQHSAQSTALQSQDLLQTYRGLVELGRIQSDESQIRAVMQLRRLHRELKGYAPPALPSQYLSRSNDGAESSSEPWWTRKAEEESAVDVNHHALVRVKTHAEDLAALTTPKGLLLTGPPGSGKSFLVDLWYDALPTPYKARKHYNELVLELYRGVWEETQHRMRVSSVSSLPPPQTVRPWTHTIRNQWRALVSTASLPKKWTRGPTNSATSAGHQQPTIAHAVARRLLLRHWLLVFDEIQLLDVSSATLLADVLSWFWRMGGVVVGTSNRLPDDLYRNGVQRERLEPFVEALKVRCPGVDVSGGGRDWRAVRAQGGGEGTWFDDGEREAFERKVESIVEGGESPSSKRLQVFGRTLTVPWSTGGISKFTFQQLCEESLGPADYLSIAAAFHTVVITSIPTLRLSRKNEARRFISLIDALYEARCRLVCLAHARPEELFFPDDAAEAAQEGKGDGIDVLLAEAVGETRDVYRPNVSSYDAPNMAHAPSPPSPPPQSSSSSSTSQGQSALETLSIFSGKDEQFAFKRALSRLVEMTSGAYGREEVWRPLPDALRKWEVMSTTPAAGVSRPSSAGPAVQSVYEDDGDFASEAAYDGGGRVDLAQRPEAPRLREEHVWGVREDWGERDRARRARRKGGGGET